MQYISKNGVGLFLLLTALLGLDVDEVLAENVVSAITLLASTGLMIWNQLSRPDSKFFFLKK
jgi:hypothetical protein